MQFKTITSFLDIYHLEKPFQDLFLNYEAIAQKKVIGFIHKIDISILSYETNFSKLIYFTLKFIQGRAKSDFEMAFESLILELDVQDSKSFDHGFSYVLNILLLGCMTYGVDSADEMKRYKEKLHTIEYGLSFMWLSLPLIKYGYCDEEMVQKALSGINLHLQQSYIEDMKKYEFDGADGLLRGLAFKYVNAGDKATGMQANHFYDMAIDIYRKYSMSDEIDAIKLKKDKVVLELEHFTMTLEPEHQEAIHKHIEKLKKNIDEYIQEGNILKAFMLGFSPCALPSAQVTKANTSIGVFTQLATVLPYTAGRNGKLKDGEHIRFHECEAYTRNLFLGYYQKIDALMQHVIENIEFEKSLQNIYKDSLFYEEQREFIVFDTVTKYLTKDYIGFMYQFVPNFEALIKILLKANGISVKNRDTQIEEDISFNSLLTGKGKELIENIYGKDFFYLLDNLFLYEYGFNLRNALMHGEGLGYLNKQYADICFYVLVVFVSRGGVSDE